MTLDLSSVMILLALQTGALGWRVARRIDGRERHPFPWVPVPDNVNIAAMLAVLCLCVIAPFTTTGLRLYAVGVLGRATFAAATVLIVAHPLVVAAHYGLWRGSRASDDGSQPYCTPAEAVMQIIALAAAALVFFWVLRAAESPTVILPAA